MTFQSQQAEVTELFSINPDAQDEIGWRITLEERAIERLTAPVNTAIRLHMPQAQEWQRKLQKHIDELARLKELLTVANTIICEQCGQLITEPHWNCDPSTETEIPF